MEKVYRLTPALKDNIWGGNKLREYGKNSNSDRIAESWELSFTSGGEARISDGRTMSEAFSRKEWGTNCDKFPFFPVLTKFIDAKDKLSVQVHPDDEYALKNEGQYGKSEMWYIVDADEGAGIYMGTNEPVSSEDFARSVEDGTVEKYLSFKRVKPGDVFFIPAGTIHAICDGVLIYEIQQNSTLTYRLYDYLRRDKDGNLRELHIDKAMTVSNLSPYEAPNINSKNPNVIGECEYFTTEKYKLNFTNKRFLVTDKSYLMISCISGEGTIEGEKIAKGDTFFVPAGAGEVEISCEDEIQIITVKTQ